MECIGYVLSSCASNATRLIQLSIIYTNNYVHT